MKNVLKNQIRVLLFVFVLMATGSLYAQPPGGGGQPGGQAGPPPVPNTKQIKEMVSNLASEISLTKEQEASALKLYTAHFEVVKEKVSGNSSPNREEMETLKANFEKEVKALLNKEQQTKYVAYLKKQGPQNQRR